MHHHLFKLFVGLLVLLTVACSSNGPVEEPEDPSIPEGPGLFSGKDGEVSLSDVFIGKRDEVNRQYYYPGPVNLGDLPPMSEENFREFENFKAWLRSREPGTPEYREYQDWRAYQQYLQYKAQQESQNTSK